MLARLMRKLYLLISIDSPLSLKTQKAEPEKKTEVTPKVIDWECDTPSATLKLQHLGLKSLVFIG